MTVKARTKVDVRATFCKVSIEVAFNPTFSLAIENCQILASLSAFGDIEKVDSRPSGQFEDTKKVVTWSMQVLKVKDKTTFNLEVVVKLPSSPVNPPSIVPVI
jgi:hypothetical protein